MIRFFPWAMVAATIILTAYGQLMLKWEVGRQVEPLFPWMREWPQVLQLLSRPGVISALVAAFAASLCWMLALKSLDLSQAYPFMALTFLVVSLAAVPLFGESITPLKSVGLVMIVLGIVFITQG
ncbi:MAG: EamA family transporter [Lysobacter sp.]|nr:EamA family transporter [Lysobacter sp.]